MALTTKQARRALTCKEQRHLSEQGIRSMAGFRKAIAWANREHAKAEEERGEVLPVYLIRCPQCFAIAHKLGVADITEA